MEFEYYPLKSEANRLKHGISFEEARGMWEVFGVIGKIEAGYEERFIRVVNWENKFYTCVYTLRLGIVRIISVRRSRDKEKEIYEGGLRDEKKENE